MHGELVFDIAWSCQPHRMGHGQHLNLKWIWKDGWMDNHQDMTNNVVQDCTCRFPIIGYVGSDS